MTDNRYADYDEISDEDRLPWLEAVEDEEGDGGPGAGRLIAWILVGLVVIGLVVGGLFWLGNRNRDDGGGGEIIAAPEGDYKVRPAEPGGMNVTGEGAAAQAASEGAEPKGRIDTSQLPETPVARPAPAAAPPAATPAPPPPRPAAGPMATIQLGAFSSQANANEAWGELSSRFRYLAPLSRQLVPVQSGGRTLYRLRASGAGAAEVCRRLQVAGETCALVN
jgi:hypothetical protein